MATKYKLVLNDDWLTAVGMLIRRVYDTATGPVVAAIPHLPVDAYKVVPIDVPEEGENDANS